MAFYGATKLGIVWYLILYDITQKHKNSSFHISQRISPQNEHSTLLFSTSPLFSFPYQKHSDQSRASSSCSYSHLKERLAVKSNNNPLQILKVYQYCHEWRAWNGPRLNLRRASSRSKATSFDISLNMKMLRRGTSTCLSIGLDPGLHHNIICDFCLEYLKTTCQYNLETAKDESRKRPKSKLCDRAWDKARYAKHQSKYKRDRMNKILALFGLTEMWKHNDLGSDDASDAPGIIASTTSPLASISLANKFE